MIMLLWLLICLVCSKTIRLLNIYVLRLWDCCLYVLRLWDYCRYVLRLYSYRCVCLRPPLSLHRVSYAALVTFT